MFFSFPIDLAFSPDGDTGAERALMICCHPQLPGPTSSSALRGNSDQLVEL
jgi:hypothetical protein